MKLTDYSFIPRNPYTAKEIQEYCLCRDWTVAKCPPSAVFAVAEAGDPSKRITIYENSIHFRGNSKIAAIFREMDMRNDEEHIIAGDKAAPTCGDLNFKHTVVGSDEIGTGERFKQIIVTAAAVAPEHMDELIRLNVTDSKKMKKAHLRQVGALLSAISPQDAWEIFGNRETTIASEGAFVEFRSRILPNSEYDKFQRAENGRDKNDLLSELHTEVLNPLIRACKPDYVVVDDFMETDKTVREEFCRSLDMEENKIFLRTKADAVNMAVSCASVISAYFGEIYLEWLTEKIKKDYDISGKFEIPPSNLGLAEQKRRLAESGADADEVIAKYAKTTFKSKK